MTFKLFPIVYCNDRLITQWAQDVRGTSPGRSIYVPTSPSPRDVRRTFLEDPMGTLNSRDVRGTSRGRLIFENILNTNILSSLFLIQTKCVLLLFKNDYFNFLLFLEHPKIKSQRDFSFLLMFWEKNALERQTTWVRASLKTSKSRTGVKKWFLLKISHVFYQIIYFFSCELFDTKFLVLIFYFLHRCFFFWTH